MAFLAKLKADSSGFKKGVSEAISALEGLNKKLVDNQFKQRDCNTTISKARSEMNKLKKEIEENEKKVKDNKNATAEEKAEVKKLNETIEKNKERIKALNDTIDKNKLNLAQLRSEQALLKNKIGETTEAIKKNDSQWTVLKGTLSNLASDALEKVGSKLVDIAKDVVSTGEQFSASMSEVQAISGATGDELESLETAARLYGSTTVYSATEAADALKYMALAGWDADQSVQGLPAVLNLAASSSMDLGTASDIVTDYITAFGLSVDDASRFVDIMAYAMSNSNTTTEQLGAAYKNCAATAASMGISVEEVTSVLMTMANAGVKGGEAGTTLNTILTRLATNAKNCADELAQYGVSIYDSSGNMESLSDILNGLSSVWGTLTEKQQANISKVIAGTNQYSGFQTIMKGLSESAVAAGASFGDYTDALSECTGSASEMSSTMQDNLSGDLKALGSALDELKLKIYDDAEGPLRGIVQWITSTGVPALESLLNNIDKIIPVVATAVTGFVAFKAAMAITEVITKLKTALASLTTSVSGVTAVITLVVTGLEALAIAIWTSGSEIKTFASKAEDCTAKLREMQSATFDVNTTLASEIGDVNSLVMEYDNLRSQTSLTTDQQNRLDTVASQLASTLGTTTDALKTEEGAYKDLTTEVNNYITALKNKALYEHYADILGEATVQIDNLEGKVKEAETVYKEASSEFNTLNDEFKELYGMGYNEAVTSGQATYLNSDLGQALTKAHDKVMQAQADYADLSNQLVTAGEASKEAEEKIKGLSGTFDAAEKSTSSYNSTMTETTDSTQSYTDKLTAANKELIENQAELKAAKAEMKALESAGGEAYESAKTHVAELQTEQTEIRNKIKGIKSDMEEAGETTEDAFTAMTNAASKYAAAVDEVNENGELSISTLTTLKSKYPELSDVIDDYVAGLKTEQDVLEGLKTIYDEDVENWKAAIVAKKGEDEDFYTSVVLKNSDLVNELKTLYGVDLTNYKSLTEAKLAMLSTVEKAMKEAQEEFNSLFTEGYDIVNNTTKGVQQLTYNGEVIGYRDTATNKWEPYTVGKTDDEKTNNIALVRKYNTYDSKRNQAIDDYYDMSAYADELDSAIAKYWNPETIDVSGGSSGSGSSGSGSSGSSSSSSQTWTMEDKGIYASGNSYKSAYFTWMDRAKNMDKLTTDEEIAILNKMLRSGKLSKDDKYEVQYRLKQAKEEKAEASKGEKTFVQNGVKGYGDTDYEAWKNWYDRAVKFDKLDTQAKYDAVDYAIKNVKMSRDEKRALEETRYSLHKDLQEEARKKKEDEEKNKQYTYTKNGVKGIGDSEYDAFKNWMERAEKFNKLSTQEKYEAYDYAIKNIEMTADQKRTMEEERYAALLKWREEKQDLALAAYKKYINDEIEERKKLADAEKAAADQELDDLKKLKEEREKAKVKDDRQKKLDSINAQLRYDRLTEFERRSLEKQRQSLLDEEEDERWNEWYDAETARINQEKTDAEKGYNDFVTNMNDLLTQFINRLDKLQGDQSYDQKVAGNSQTVNIQIIKDALSDDQIIAKILKELGIK